jgi:hypothetical protein
MIREVAKMAKKEEEVKEEEKAEATAEAKDGENALAVAAQAPLTKEETAEANKRFEKRIDEFKSQTMKVNSDALQLNWEKGKFVDEMLSDPKKYGNRSADHVAEAFGISKELVYAYHRFFHCYTQEDVARCVKMGISFHNIFFLLSVTDVGKRRELEEQVSSGKINAPQLQEQVKAFNQKAKATAKSRGKKVDNRGGITASKVVKSTHHMCVDMARKLDEFAEAYREWKKMEDGQVKSAVAISLKETKKALASLIDKAQKTFTKFEV